MRGREGGERRGRQGNRGLNLDTNLNRYCPSRSAGLMRRQAANSAAAPKLGDPACAFCPFLSFSPSYFLSPYLHFSHPPAPFCLCFSPLLAACSVMFLPGSLPCPRFPLQACRLSSLLFVCEEDLFSSNCSFPSLSLHTSR